MENNMTTSHVLALALALTALPAAAQDIHVHLSPTCGCCKAWVKHLEQAGFTPRIVESRDMAASKRALRVPDKVESCHTAVVEGYIVEGHVPASDIRRLLKERPAALGLAVPDMPVGSPGMEVPGVAPEKFETLLVGVDGETSIYGKH
ncbi:DUF411 domain-containing protein [Bosea sp. RAC05]|uniref:DUF411 domain-containing protein n=1 Tax=Bosea sp. RAC05 TaxID=1842539 RepID=UPI0012370F51|nr:DUF411 domain-containing protein [Bosea sp. RAC05]